jgi:hypothetical protein
MHRVASSCLSTALVLTVSSPAFAAPPERGTEQFTGKGVPFFPCTELGHEFDVLIDFISRERYKIWRDTQGRITRIKAHVAGEGTIYPTNDPTNRNTGSSPTNITIDFEAQTLRISGQEFRNVVPGEGRVAHSSGTIVIPIDVTDRVAGDFEFAGGPVHVGGPHPDFDEIPWCEMFD